MVKRFVIAFSFVLAVLGGMGVSCAQSPWAFDAEALFLQVNSTVGTRQNNAFGYEPGQRYTLSYMNENNLGIRGRYFSYATNQSDPGISTLLMDIWNTDVEIFKQIQITKSTMVDFSGGVRFSETESFFPSRFEPNDFTGLGGLLGARGTTKVFDRGALYARGSLALLTGEGFHDANGLNVRNANEVSRTQTEIGLGYQHSFSFRNVCLTPHVGAEWMNLSGYQNDVVDEHPESDMMLAGFTTGLGIRF